MTVKQYGQGGFSNSTRAIAAGGNTYPTLIKSMDYLQMATLGNSINFGDIYDEVVYPGAFASPTRGVIGGGSAPSNLADINYVTIATTGDSVDFGDLTSGRNSIKGISNVNGGL